ncbi:MAG TPA: amidohydrolase family protein [Longimicrobiaceae bacterium]
MDDRGSARRLSALALAAAAVLAGTAWLAPNAVPTATPAIPLPQKAVTAFRGVTVIPMDSERLLPDQTVIVTQGRIQRIGPSASVAIPAGANTIEAAGKFLIPGLAEMHAHIPTSGAGSPEVDRTLFLYLAGGVTTIRGMLGHPSHLDLRERAERDEILSPRIFTSGPSFSGGSAASAEAAAAMVRAQKEAGYDFLKLHPGLTRPVFDAIAAEADRVGIPFAGHVSAEVGLERALEAGYASIDHLDGYVEALAGYGGGFGGTDVGFFGFNVADRADAGRIHALAHATKAAGVWNVPTQSLMESLASPTPAEEMARRPEMRYMPPQTIAQWVQRKRDFVGSGAYSPERAARYLDLRRGLIRALHEAGAGLVLGSDAPQWWNVPGFSARREVEYMVTAGLSPYAALEMATRNPAVYFGSEADRGTIAEGKAADLILLDANPLQDIASLWRQAGVMVRGRWLPQAEIQRRLDAIAAELGT